MTGGANRIPQFVKFLVEQGSNVNARNGRNATPIEHAASRNPNTEILRFLVTVPGADVNAVCDEGRTPLDVASDDERRAILRAVGGKLASEL